MKLPQIETRRPHAPEGCVVYAVGDLHGRLDVLTRATDDIERRAAEEPAARTIVVLLGDYIDRGPHSAAVVDHLIGLASRATFEPVFLRGNHEQSVLDVVDGKPEGAQWLSYGGRETLASYGLVIAEGAYPSLGKLQAASAKAIPPEHIAFLRSTEIYRKLGDYIFVHAGMRPDRLVEEQSKSDMLWLRHLGDERPLWSETVVHGHCPHPRPIEGRWHIGIDTGAHDTGALTVLRLEGDRRQFLKVVRGGVGEAGISLWEAVDRVGARQTGERRTPRAIRNFKDRWTT